MTVFLHGFWGQPSDWNAVLTKLPLGMPVWAPDLYEPVEISPALKLEAWVDAFLDECLRRFGSRPIQLVGYSMGGRLALNVVHKAPDRFSRVLLVSSAPYLMSGSIAERREFEASWAKRFLSEPWETLESAWQDVPVLASSTPLPRRKTSALRELLGLSLTNWSLCDHMVDEAAVKALPRSVEWAFGALDQKYLEIAKSLQNLPVKGQIQIIQNAGHRIPTDAPDFVRRWVEEGRFS